MVIFVLVLSVMVFLQVEMKAGWQKGHAHWWIFVEEKINPKFLAAAPMIRVH